MKALLSKGFYLVVAEPYQGGAYSTCLAGDQPSALCSGKLELVFCQILSCSQSPVRRISLMFLNVFLVLEYLDL